MNQTKFDQIQNLKLQDIVDKLNKLECTLLGSRDEAWIMELFFKPGLHRCQLMEWILSKLTDSAFKVGPQVSVENRLKRLQATVSEYGLCRDKSIVEGNAALKDQLEFWSFIMDIVWTRHEINSSDSDEDSCKGDTAVPVITIGDTVVNEKRNKIAQEFQATCVALDQFLKSGAIQHIFKDKLQFLDPDIEKEITDFQKETASESKMFKDPDYEIQKEQTEKNLSVSKILENLCSNEISVDQHHNFVSKEELNRTEEELKQASNDFLCSAEQFSNVYKDLKPLVLNAKAHEFEDAGPDFQNAETLLKDMLELEMSFDKLQCSTSQLEKINSDLDDLLKDEALSDENFTRTFKLLNDKS